MNTVAFVTGAASGIGRALAQQLADQGARVWLADRDPAVQAAADAIGGHAIVLDVTDRAAVQHAIAACAQAEGRLDLVVNNAGVGIAAEVRDTAEPDWRRIIEVNLFGVIHGVDAAYPIMIKQGFGHIVNVASVAGLVPLPGEAAYVASKHAVVGLSRTLRAEAVGLGIKVSTVCPGVVKTPIYDASPVVGFDKERVLALWPKGISADSCAARILRGVRRNQAMIIITPTAQVLWRINRWAPRAFGRAAQVYMRVLRRARVA